MDTLTWACIGFAVYLGFGFMIGIPHMMAKTKSQFVAYWVFWPGALVYVLLVRDSRRVQQADRALNTAELREFAASYIESHENEPAGATGEVVVALCEKLEKGTTDPPARDRPDPGVAGSSSSESAKAPGREQTVADVADKVKSTWSRLKQHEKPKDGQRVSKSDSGSE